MSAASTAAAGSRERQGVSPIGEGSVRQAVTNQSWLAKEPFAEDPIAEPCRNLLLSINRTFARGEALTAAYAAGSPECLSSSPS